MDTEKIMLTVNTIGYIIEIIGIMLTFLCSPKLMAGYLPTDKILARDLNSKKYVKLGFGLIVFGASMQMIQPFIKYF